VQQRVATLPCRENLDDTVRALLVDTSGIFGTVVDSIDEELLGTGLLHDVDTMKGETSFVVVAV
jgi:hypothetical protein